MPAHSIEIKPVTLEGNIVRLEPLSMAHHRQLCEFGLDPALWRWTTNRLRTPDEMGAYIEDALAGLDRGTVLPFATVDLASGKAAGSTRFLNIDLKNLRVEIGATWVAKPWQRTGVNTEAKYLMLRYAFEKLGCIRVELKTDSRNRQSREAILRIGAKEEGILRNHMLTWSGRVRHTVYYSIIDSEWPEVKAQLEEKLNQTTQ